MRLRSTKFLRSVVLLAIFLTNKLNAQTTTSGGLTGVVTDQSKAVVPNVDIEIKDDAKGTTLTTQTDREGMYRFFFLAPARYILRASHEGFQSETRVLNVLLGPPVTVNVILEVPKESVMVTVTGEAALVQADNGDVSNTINDRQISEVPNPGNDLTYIVQTAPGVVMNTDSQNTATPGFFNFSILGMPGNSYHSTVDGMSYNANSNNEPMSGALGLALGQNQVQEVNVVSIGYSGQFGGAAGGTVSYITRSGTNAVHGNVQYYWNGRMLNANDFGNNEFGLPRPFSIANQWAGSLGGPIAKNKLFFFFDTKGSRVTLAQVTGVTTPAPQFEAATLANIDSRFGPASASEAFYRKIFNLYDAAPGATSARPGGFSPSDPTGCTGFAALGPGVPCALNFLSNRSRPSADTLVSGRVDWNAGKSDRAFIRIQGEPGLGAFYVDPISPLFDADYQVSLWQGQLNETHTFGSSAASQLLMSGSQYSFKWKDKHAEAITAFPTVLNFSIPGVFNSLGGLGLVGAYGPQIRTYQFSEDMVKVHRDHKLGFGANFLRIHWNVPSNKVNALGQLNPVTLDAFYQGGVDPASFYSDFTTLTQSFTSQASVPVSYFNFGLYGQDEWHAKSKLSLTFAFRAEHYSNPVCDTGCFARPVAPFEAVAHDPEQPYNQVILINQKHALQSIDSVRWSPRFAFAWQPFGVSHSSVLRGGLGLLYNPLPDSIMESFYINSPIYNVYTVFGDNLTPTESTSLFKDAAASNTAFVNGFSAGKNLAQIQASDHNFAPPALTASERKMHSPQYQRWSLQW
jgi:hypothetical protein